MTVRRLRAELDNAELLEWGVFLGLENQWREVN